MTQTPSHDAARHLNADLLAAHDRGDHSALIDLYEQAASAAFEDGDINQGAFFLTHARVFALEAGDPRADAFFTRLKDLGRDR